MTDIKTMKVAPEMENEAIRLWQDFGYNLKNSQEMYNKSIYLDQNGLDYLFNQFRSVETTVHYVKLIFERDHNIPHYQELRDLEDQFNAVPHPGERGRRYSSYEIFMGLMACTVPGVLRWMHNRYLDRTADDYSKALKEFNNRQRQIREKAAAIVRS